MFLSRISIKQVDSVSGFTTLFGGGGQFKFAPSKNISPKALDKIRNLLYNVGTTNALASHGGGGCTKESGVLTPGDGRMADGQPGRSAEMRRLREPLT